MLNPKRSDGSRVNDPTYAMLHTGGVDVHWTSPPFAVSQEKSILVDPRRVLVGTFNTCTACFSKVRDYALITNDPLIVAEFRRCYQADWDEKAFEPAPESPLLWSDANSRKKRLNLLIRPKKHWTCSIPSWSTHRFLIVCWRRIFTASGCGFSAVVAAVSVSGTFSNVFPPGGLLLAAVFGFGTKRSRICKQN